MSRKWSWPLNRYETLYKEREKEIVIITSNREPIYTVLYTKYSKPIYTDSYAKIISGLWRIS